MKFIVTRTSDYEVREERDFKDFDELIEFIKQHPESQHEVIISIRGMLYDVPPSLPVVEIYDTWRE